MRLLLHSGANWGYIIEITTFLFEFECDSVSFSQLLIDQFRRFEGCDVIYDKVIDCFMIFFTILGQMQLQPYYCLSGEIMTIASDLGGPISCFKQRQEWIFTLMTDDVSNVVVRMMLIVRFAAINCPEEFHKHLIFDRLHLNPFPYFFFLKMKLVLNSRYLLILNFLEKWHQFLFHFINGHRWQ